MNMQLSRGLCLILILCGLLASCVSASPGVGTGATTVPTPLTTTPAASPCAAGCPTSVGIQEAVLFTEPSAGAKPVVDAIATAHTSVWLEIYLLTERSVINALEDAANRGIHVQVMLEGHPYGSSSVSPQETIAALQAAGVSAQVTNPAFQLTHAKLMIIDGRTALISSANYTHTALGGTSSYADRDYLITDTNAADVQECVAIFTADWNRTTPALSDPNLIVSPINARARLLGIIQNATKSLHIEAEEMSDPQVVQALAAAQQRGMTVTIVVPIPIGSSDDTNERQLVRDHVSVYRINDKTNGLYIHAKIIVADGTLAFVGSENISTASLDSNREIGVLIANTTVIQGLDATFAQDVASGQAV